NRYPITILGMAVVIAHTLPGGAQFPTPLCKGAPWKCLLLPGASKSLSLADCWLVLLLIGFVLACFLSWFRVDQQTRKRILQQNGAVAVLDFHMLALIFVFICFTRSILNFFRDIGIA